MISVRDIQSGSVFGRWTVKEKTSGGSHPRFLCVCVCGAEKNVLGGTLVDGDSTSCGCYRRDWSSQHTLKHGHAQTRERIASPEYRAWSKMIVRCYNPKTKNFKNWGGRGIIVCDRWRFGDDGKSGFECFLADVGLRLSPRHSIDRWPDKDGNYEPGNVRWATPKEQANNRRPMVPTQRHRHPLVLTPEQRRLRSENGRLAALKRWAGLHNNT